MSNDIERAHIVRRDFVNRFMDAGFSYAQSITAYKEMCAVIEEGIISGCKIVLGRAGALCPAYKPPRDYHMHFRRVKGNKVQTGMHRTYFMDGRFEYKFRLFKTFANNNELNWLPPFPEDGEESE